MLYRHSIICKLQTHEWQAVLLVNYNPLTLYCLLQFETTLNEIALH